MSAKEVTLRMVFRPWVRLMKLGIKYVCVCVRVCVCVGGSDQDDPSGECHLS